MSIIAGWEPEKYTFLLLFTTTNVKQGRLYTLPILCYFLPCLIDLFFPSRLHYPEITSWGKCACWMCYPPFYLLLGGSVQKKTQVSTRPIKLFAAILLNFYHQASLSSASAGWCPYSHSLFEQGLDGMPLHWWALALNFAFKWLTVDDDENA